MTAQIDALRASVYELRERGIDPTSEEYELTWMVAGGPLAQLRASEATIEMISNIDDDVQRGALAAWSPARSTNRARPPPVIPLRLLAPRRSSSRATRRRHDLCTLVPGPKAILRRLKLSPMADTLPERVALARQNCVRLGLGEHEPVLCD